MNDYVEEIEKVKNFLNDRRCARTERESKQNLAKSYCHIKALNDYIDEKIDIDSDTIQQMIDHLIGYNTIIFDFLLPLGIKIKRGHVVPAEEVKSVQRLSYNPDSAKTPKGRFNPEKHSSFYGVIYFKPDCGTNIVFSELDAKEGSHVCILNSKITKELISGHIGVFARLCQNNIPWYLDELIWNYYNEITVLYQYLSHESDFKAFLMTENFLSEVASRKETRIYNVTQAIADILLYGEDVKNIDSLVYDSVYDGETPNIIIKPSAVDEKMTFLDAEEFLVLKKFPENLYRATVTAKGKINETGDMEWSSTVAGDEC